MNLSRKLIAQLGHVKAPFIASVLVTLLISFAIVIQAFLLARIIDGVFLQEMTWRLLAPWLVLFGIVSTLRLALGLLENHTSSSIARTLKERLRKQLLHRLAHRSITGGGNTDEKQTGEFVNTVTQGVDALEAYFSEYLPQLVLAVFCPVLILCFVFPVDVLSGVVFLVTAPLIPLFMVLIGDAAKAMTQKQWLTLSKMSAFFLDVIQGITTLKTLGRSRHYQQKIADVSDAHRQTTMKVLRVAFLSALTLELLATLGTAVIAVEIGIRLLYGRLTFAQALFVLILAPDFYQPLRQLGARFHAGMEGFEASKRIFQLLELPFIQTQGSKQRQLDLRENDIVFDRIGYQYPDTTRPVFSDVSFTLKPGQKVVLVGPSGTGKTTLCSLLLKLRELQEGDIRIGEQSLNAIPMAQWQHQITWVSQHPYLFHAPLRQNLLIAKPDASIGNIQHALEKAHLHDVLERLPDGLDTVIGERGAKLSGGQAQRVALARAFLKDSPLIVLDEPTSNLDPMMENTIHACIDDLSHKKTLLIVAHRLNTLKQADTILACSPQGHVSQVTYEEVLAQQRSR